MKHLLKLTRFIKPYWKPSVISLSLLTAVVFMDLAIPRLVQRIIDQGITPKDMQVIISTTLIMLGISVLSTLFAIGNNYLSVMVGEKVGLDLREELFIKTQSFSFGNLDRLRTGQLMVRLTSDVAMLQRVTRMSLRIGTRAPLLMVGSMILMIGTDKHLAISMLPLLLITGVVMGLFVTRIGPLFLTVQQKLDNLNNVLQENIAGVRVIKAFVRADHENQRFETVNEEYTDHNVKVMQFSALLFPVLTFLINIGIVMIIWSGGLQSIQGDLTIGEIVAFVNYLLTTMSPMMIMTMLTTVFATANVSAKRVNEVLESAPEVQDQPQAPALPPQIQGQVAFKDVAFHYNGTSDELVLRDINLTAKPGETIAILGATGAGKSTLINLIPRFYDVSEGRVTLDGIDILRFSRIRCWPRWE
jgi:ATP-binding cassette subfamily B multidrug efflux pump